jgi:hypothetical protein
MCEARVRELPTRNCFGVGTRWTSGVGGAQNAFMPRIFVLSLLVVSATLLAAQQPATTARKPNEAGVTAGNLPNDLKKMAAAIRGSYYHPDDLSSLDCDVNIDWTAFSKALKLDAQADRMAMLQGLKIRSSAPRGKLPEVKFDWTAGVPDNSDKLTDGLKKMIGGFYQFYWPMIAASPVANANDMNRVEPLPDGTKKIYSSAQSINMVMAVDKENTPTHYAFDGTVIKGTMNAHYVASPHPAPGDLRRVSSMDVSEETGNSAINVAITLDYQEADGFYVPKNVSFNLMAHMP